MGTVEVAFVPWLIVVLDFFLNSLTLITMLNSTEECYPPKTFHGTYDFALLMITSSWQRSNKEQYFNDAGGDISVIAIISFCASFFIVLLGGLYYFFLSKAQYKRLRGTNSGGSGSVLAAGLLT